MLPVANNSVKTDPIVSKTDSRVFTISVSGLGGKIGDRILTRRRQFIIKVITLNGDCVGSLVKVLKDDYTAVEYDIVFMFSLLPGLELIFGYDHRASFYQ